MSGCHTVFKRGVALGAAIFFAACLPARAHAQIKTSVIAVAEHDTDDVNIGLLGVGFSPAAYGWGWAASVSGYRLTYPGHGVWSLTPAVGVRDLMHSGELSFKVGYNLVSDKTSTFVGGTAFVPVVQTGSKKGVVGSFQGGYWGNGGPLGAELISDYNFASKSTWDRARLSTRIVKLNPRGALRLGGEVVYMNGGGYQAWQAGPTLEYQTGTGMYITGAVGGKWPQYRAVSQKNAAYFAINFVWSL